LFRISLNDTQKIELRQVARQAMGRISERAHFVLLSADGFSATEIGNLMGYQVQTVRAWLGAYQERQCAGLQDQPRSGRPRKHPYLTAIVQAQASQPPPNSGYLQACWTVALLVLHLAQRFRVVTSIANVRRALHHAGFGWKRPKLAPAHRRDAQTDAKLARIAEVLADPEAVLLAEDECDAQLLAVLRAMWQRIGAQVRIVTPGQNAKRGIFGALNLRSGTWFYRVTTHKRSTDFIAFLTQILAAYPTGQIFMLVDNVSIHASKLLLAWLALQPRLALIYLPTYSGHQLNPVEKVWWALKKEIAANRSFKSLHDLDVAIHRFFDKFSPTDALALVNSETVRNAQFALVLK
jgi:transposase